jgi:hypothetical protein
MQLWLFAAACALFIDINRTLANDAVAIAVLESAGAAIHRDDTVEDKPVVHVTCNLVEITPEFNRALKEVETLPSIEFLGAGGTEISVETIHALQGKKSLKEFSISFAKVSDESAQILGTLRSLQILELRSQTEISPKGMSEILQLTGLQELTLSDRLVTDETVAALSRFPNLSVLNLRSVFVSDEGLKTLRRIRNLRKLGLFVGSKVTSEGFKILAELNLTHLDLIYSNVDNEKLKELRRLSGLRSLRLINAAKVTDDGIPYLSELTELKDLDLANATLTKAGIEHLKKALPNCAIVYEARQRN